MEKYKTIKQLDAEMNIGNFYCKCRNSGVNSFTGMCSNCGKRKQTDSEKLDKLIGHLYEKFGKEKIETVKNLISSTPNDQELGKKVREMFR